MASFKRRHLIAANWKMHKTVTEALDYYKRLIPLIHPVEPVVIFLAVPFTSLYSVAHEAELKKANLPITIGAQNMSDQKEGALTGEISVEMLREAGAKFVILGHSERRRLFNEDNHLIDRKVALALEAGLQALLCVGETKEEREAGKTEEIIEKQLVESLASVEPDKAKQVIVAYEPVWAIGNGHAATPDDAEKVQAFIRQWVKKKWGEELSQKMRILYGGSVNANNAKEFLTEENIDGLLVGGASLDPKSFSDIINLN